MAKKITREKILQANKAGLDQDFRSYHTPVLMVAHTLGYLGIDLSDAPIVRGYRYGRAPQSFISQNYQDNTAEHGLSLAALDGGEECWSVMWVGDRKKYYYTGILSDTGSDGEPLILCLEAEDWDDWN
jgi:hypothetical protein